MPAIPFAVVILAAGASSRMGRPKMLLPWGEASVIGHLVSTWRQLGARQLTVVCAPGHGALHVELERAGVPPEHRILNPTPQLGMFSSVLRAAHWTGWQPELTHWVLSLGDQPHVRLETLRALLEFAAAHPESICQPAYQGRRRHPVILPKRAFTALSHSKAEHLKQFLQDFSSVASCEVNDPGLNLDLDTPEDYERAIKQFSS